MARRRNARYKKMVPEYAELCGKGSESYQKFEESKSTFYEWKKILRERGAHGLIPRKPIALHHPGALPADAVEKVLDLRKTCCLGPQWIT